MLTSTKPLIPDSLTVSEFFQHIQAVLPDDPFDQLSKLLQPPFHLPLRHSPPGVLGEDWKVFGSGPAVRLAKRDGSIESPKATVQIQAPHGKWEVPLAELHVRYLDVLRIFDHQLGWDVIPWTGGVTTNKSWISVDSYWPPKNLGPVMLWINGRVMMGYRSDGKWFVKNQCGGKDKMCVWKKEKPKDLPDPTHWMTLPDGPEPSNNPDLK